MDCDKTKEVVF